MGVTLFPVIGQSLLLSLFDRQGVDQECCVSHGIRGRTRCEHFVAERLGVR